MPPFNVDIQKWMGLRASPAKGSKNLKILLYWNTLVLETLVRTRLVLYQLM